MSDDTIYPAEIYPGGSEAEFAMLKKHSTLAFEEFVRRRWGDVRLCERDWLIAVMGMPGEVGETVEAALNLVVASSKASELMKKHYRDGKDPGLNLQLEMGDVLHYLTVLAQSYGWTLQEIMQANIEKLKARDAARGR
jgi:NTP pyrophosphatase (non-canonical NTP hydrolase)